jgi:hypothetical protein
MKSPVTKATNSALMDDAQRLGARLSSVAGELMPVLAELDKREGWRDEGAASLVDWIVQRCGVSRATARSWVNISASLDDLPHVAGGLARGALSLDKVRAVMGRCTPENDAEMALEAQSRPVVELADLDRRAQGAPTRTEAQAAYDARYLRFNDERRTMVAQLPQEHYAAVRAALNARIKDITSDGETPLDQRQCDALIAICLNGATDPDTGTGKGQKQAYLIVAHTDLSYLQGGEGSAELEHLGLLSAETIQRLACDATVALAIDDDGGHTMYEGRAQRFPTPTQRREIFRRDKWCRFGDCSHTTFTNVHHLVPWHLGGLTDVDNLLLLCEFHHHRVHEAGWKVRGDPNGELVFVAPNGKEITSRPSASWGRKPRQREPGQVSRT